MRVGVISLQHESNTFVPHPTPFAAFERDRLLTGSAMRDAFAQTHHEVGGFFDQLRDDGFDAVPVFAAWTMPSGTIEASAANALTRRLMAAVSEAGPIDGWLVAPHGAAVAHGEPDFDGFWLTQLRNIIGHHVPMIGTLDLHANLSPRMARALDGWFAYRTNPHIDQHATGRQAATLLARTLRNECRPTTAAAFPPFVVNIESQATSEQPCRELMEHADAIRRRPGVRSVAVLLGFPYADVPELGAALTVTTDNNPSLARQYAIELAEWWWENRKQFHGRLNSPHDAVASCRTLPAPVCLLDMGDNVGGGGPADSTILAHEILKQRITPAFVCLNDPEAVASCFASGVGSVQKLSVGGKSGERHGAPIALTFTIRGLFDGLFDEPQARHGGLKRFDQGPTVVLVSEQGLTVMLTSRRTAPFSLRQLTAFGIDPTQFRILVAKGVHAPVAAYAPICPTLLRVNTSGVTSADLSHFDYRHRRRPLDPFEPETPWTPEAT